MLALKVIVTMEVNNINFYSYQHINLYAYQCQNQSMHVRTFCLIYAESVFSG